MESNVVKMLVDERMLSKYFISKELGVSWNTVHMWYKGVFEPSLKHKEAIDERFGEEVQA